MGTGHGKWILLRDAALVAAVAVLVFQGLRRWCGDRCLVPSDSMEPVLHGDPVHGDRVFVARMASRANVGRGDLVVVRHPEEPGAQLVKRVAAVGDDPDACWIDLRDGDVWLGPDSQHLRREVKEPAAARGLRVPWAGWPGRAEARLDVAAARVGEALSLSVPPLDAAPGSLRTAFDGEARARRRQRHGGAMPAGFVGTSRAVDASYVERSGRPSRSGEDVGVSDCGMDLRVRSLPETFVGALDSRREAIVFVFTPSTGRLDVWRDGLDVATAQLPAITGGPCRIEFGRLDDRIFFLCGDVPAAAFVMARPREWNDRAAGSGWPRTHVYAGALGSRPLELEDLLVFHDLHVFRERIAGMPGQAGSWPRPVPAGSWFLLGDNAFDSRDSRHFDAVPCDRFLGRPIAVLGPWPATRWLPR